MFRRHFLTLALASIAAPSMGVSQPYGLAPGRSTITYTFVLNGNRVRGTVPITQADLTVDPNNLAASTADVTADVRAARTGLIFATEALKSASVLNTADFPLARFRSTQVILGPGGRISDGAALRGDLTLRGVTRPVQFKAGLFRTRGSTSNDLSALSVQLSGQINRRDFGAVGYPDLVDDIVGIDIAAEISANG
ncbi:YceI family protein [uncultured Tateyamaria sp.]|uniref:YceI family protein n=1 Tax=uncultured Tateyamaria sp. TaxID=455651 RepID=UPI0026066E0D|nr:YceI family protein [uncultured Tateyamaria sp.]